MDFKSLVDRALELDRKKLVKKLSKLNNKFKLQSSKSEMLKNFVGKLPPRIELFIDIFLAVKR